MAGIPRTKPFTNVGSGSLYYDLWLKQGKKCAISGTSITMSSSVYVNSTKTTLYLEAPLAILEGYVVNGTIQEFLEARGYIKVDLSSTIGENKAQQVGDPNVW